uniref:Uncharacterized protein n=1 Tax=Emiliania huxleyi TaxID=2903 RepID=A0A7S3X212_EMIHU
MGEPRHARARHRRARATRSTIARRRCSQQTSGEPLLLASSCCLPVCLPACLPADQLLSRRHLLARPAALLAPLQGPGRAADVSHLLEVGQKPDGCQIHSSHLPYHLI